MPQSRRRHTAGGPVKNPKRNTDDHRSCTLVLEDERGKMVWFLLSEWSTDDIHHIHTIFRWINKTKILSIWDLTNGLPRVLCAENLVQHFVCGSSFVVIQVSAFIICKSRNVLCGQKLGFRPDSILKISRFFACARATKNVISLSGSRYINQNTKTSTGIYNQILSLSEIGHFHS